MNTTFPFTTLADDDGIKIEVLTNSAEVQAISDLFSKHQYTPNGYCWEGHIVQMLEKNKPELMEVVEFDSNEEAFVAYAEGKRALNSFLKIIQAIFTNSAKLEEYIKAADRERIDS